MIRTNSVLIILCLFTNYANGVTCPGSTRTDDDTNCYHASSLNRYTDKNGYPELLLPTRELSWLQRMSGERIGRVCADYKVEARNKFLEWANQNCIGGSTAARLDINEGRDGERVVAGCSVSEGRLSVYVGVFCLNGTIPHSFTAEHCRTYFNERVNIEWETGRIEDSNSWGGRYYFQNTGNTRLCAARLETLAARVRSLMSSADEARERVAKLMVETRLDRGWGPTENAVYDLQARVLELENLLLRSVGEASKIEVLRQFSARRLADAKAEIVRIRNSITQMEATEESLKNQAVTPECPYVSDRINQDGFQCVCTSPTRCSARENSFSNTSSGPHPTPPAAEPVAQ